jgi:L-aminopeptidase/D-esterase-like protein
MKGGIGCAAFRYADLKVGAVFAVNCLGDVYEGGRIIAGARGDTPGTFANGELVLLSEYNRPRDAFTGHTVIGCIITNAKLSKAAATRLAGQGQNGIARMIRPAHTLFDGDTVFAMCSGDIPTTPDAAGVLASVAVEQAILDAVKSARPLAGFPSMNQDSEV